MMIGRKGRKEKMNITKIETEKKPKKLRVAAYCRVSTDKDAQEESLEAQITHYRNLIKNHNPDNNTNQTPHNPDNNNNNRNTDNNNNQIAHTADSQTKNKEEWELAEVYYDFGITGTKKEVRPALMRLLSDCGKEKIDLIITKSISRFSRNTTDCLEMVRSLLALNIPVIFESENINTSLMDGELLLSIMSSVAEAESQSISENTKWGVRKRFMDGSYRYSLPPYGYEKKRETIEINPEKAKIVRRVFDEIISGKGTHIVAKELNAEGVPSARGGKWSSTTILGMIRNDAYTGKFLCQKTYTDSNYNRHANYGQADRYVIENHHQPIITEEIYIRANETVDLHAKERGIIKEHNRNDNTYEPKYHQKYFFTGKIRCGECGGTFKRVTFDKYSAWACQKHISGECGMKYIKEEKIEEAYRRAAERIRRDEIETIKVITRNEAEFETTGGRKIREII